MCDNEIELLINKGKFPYSYLDEISKLEQKEFPTID